MTVKACECGYIGDPIVIPVNGPHYARQECGCGRFLGWEPKPDGEGYRRPASHKELVKKFGRGFCELCLRTKDVIRSEDTFHGHHVIPFADGGESTRQNVWILCTACHRHVDWMRTYVGRVAPPKKTATPSEDER